MPSLSKADVYYYEEWLYIWPLTLDLHIIDLFSNSYYRLPIRDSWYLSQCDWCFVKWTGRKDVKLFFLRASLQSKCLRMRVYYTNRLTVRETTWHEMCVCVCFNVSSKHLHNKKRCMNDMKWKRRGEKNINVEYNKW